MTAESRVRARSFAGMRNFEFETMVAKDEKGKNGKLAGRTETEWKEQIIKELKALDTEWTAFIFHNRDEETEGTKKGLHVHIVERFDNPRDFKPTRLATGCESRNFNKLRSESSALLYLTHTTAQAIRDRKTRYEVQELYVFVNEWVADEDGNKSKHQRQLTGEELERWYRLKIAGKAGDNVSTDDEVARIIDELSAGEKQFIAVKDELKELFDPTTATMSWMKNKRYFKEAVQEYYEAKYLDMLDKGRGDSFKLIYIQGMSEIGKTVFANKLARYYNESKGIRGSLIHNAPNDSRGSTYDFLSGYNQELVTVFDDLKPTTFGYTEFLNLFEKERVAKYSSRFQNKPWFSELAIITKSTDIDEFTNKLSYSELRTATPVERDNILYQPRRRFSFVLNLATDVVKIQAYQVTNKKTNEHKLVTLETIEVPNNNFHDDKFQRKLLKKFGKYVGIDEATTNDLKKLDKDLSLSKLNSEVNAKNKKIEKKEKEKVKGDEEE